MLVHWTVAEDIRALARIRAALDAGRPLPLALARGTRLGRQREADGARGARLDAADCARLVGAAQTVDGIAKGLRHPDWLLDAWAALRRLALMLTETAAGKTGIALQA